MLTQRNVPFFNYPALYKKDEAGLLAVVTDVLSRGAYILQRDLMELEQNLQDFLGVKHVIGVADGTNALLLSLWANDVGAGDEVILPSHTYVATAAAVHYAGATPVPVECGIDHMIDPESVRAAITPRTKVIMPVQLNGRTADMDAIRAIAEAHGLMIIEDAAQALGSRWKGQAAGSFGRAGTFSFYPAKLMGCFGDGGAVITNHDDVATRVRLLRDHGRDEDGEVVTWGTNSRLDNLQAAVLGFRLKTYTQDIARRREIAQRYQDGLGDVAELVLPPAPVDNGDHFDVYQNYEIEAERRDDLKAYLRERGIGTIVQFGGKSIHQFPLGFEGVSLPFTERLYTRMLLLPLHVALSNADVDHVIAGVRGFYGATGGI